LSSLAGSEYNRSVYDQRPDRIKRFDIFLTDGHRLTTNEEGYRAIKAGMGAALDARLVRVNTVRGERVAHSIELNVDHVITISAVDDGA
jgi:ligand-binding sensor domain-containing protein